MTHIFVPVTFTRKELPGKAPTPGEIVIVAFVEEFAARAATCGLKLTSKGPEDVAFPENALIEADNEMFPENPLRLTRLIVEERVGWPLDSMMVVGFAEIVKSGVAVDGPLLKFNATSSTQAVSPWGVPWQGNG